MLKNLYPRLLPAPEMSFFLFGMRGVGKSTWAKARFPAAHQIDLLDQGLYQAFLTDVRLFAGELRRQKPGGWVVVDEVQRLPALLNDVHRFMENQGLRFVLLGSSARKLKTAGTNLLAGRALKQVMDPLLPEELGGDFNLDEVLRFGSLPIIWQSAARRESLKAYVQLYLKEEIQAEAIVRNLPGFARFLPVAALFHGQVLNVAGLGRDVGVARPTVSGYLEILEDTHLAYRLPAFEGKLRVKERKHPKLYWADSGVARASKGQFDPPGAEELGVLFEGWVASLLKAYGALRGLYDQLYYWAPAQGGTEVDFLLQRGTEFVAIEVKAARTISSPHLTGLKAIADLPGIRRRVLVYLGERPFNTETGVEVLPVEEFLRELQEGSL